MPRKILLLLSVAGVIVGSAGVQAQGLMPAPDALGGPFWQARFERDSVSLLPPGLVAPVASVGTAQNLRLLGDYQFSSLRLGETGGLRLTGGLLIQLRQPQGGVPTNDLPAALPYAGVGWATGRGDGAWGFSADLGLAAQGLGSLRLDRLVNGGGSLSVDGSLRLLPMIHLGVSLAF
ncbi:MAG: hypothetical protein Q7U26_12550 [Aquabacterium sp.]|nr:hypothetical protein [Aquabacterium sp.]